MGKFAKVLLLAGMGLLMGAPARATTPPTQCVANVLAGGTANAITTITLPCALTTNLLLLTNAAGSNTSTTPTLQPLGLTAQVIERSDGTPLQVGDMGSVGNISMLTPTGTVWKLLNPAGSNAGGVGAGLQYQLAEYPANGTAVVGTFAPNFPSTGLWYQNLGANITRLNDQVLIGGATAWSGKSGTFSSSTPLDWLSTFQSGLTLAPPLSGGLGAGSITFSTLSVLNQDNTASVNNASALTTGAHSFYFTSAGTSLIGHTSVVLNDNTTLATPGWAFYGEAHCTGNVNEACYGIEVDPRTTFVNTIVPGPFQQGIIDGYQLGCGAGVTGGQNCDVGIQVVANPNLFKIGLNFISGSIVNRSGFGQTAIAMATNMTTQWYNGATLEDSIGGDSSGNFDINITSGALQVNGNVGLSCPGINAGTFRSALGIVTHC